MLASIITFLSAFIQPIIDLWRLMFSLRLGVPTTCDEQNVEWTLPGGAKILAPSRYVRVALTAPFQTENCIVSVRRIKLEGKLSPFSQHSSTLAWRGKKGAERFKPQRLARGDSKEVDICKYDALQQRLQLLTERSDNGEDIFARHGIYEIEIIATGETIRRAESKITVTFDGTMQLLVH